MALREPRGEIDANQGQDSAGKEDSWYPQSLKWDGAGPPIPHSPQRALKCPDAQGSDCDRCRPRAVTRPCSEGRKEGVPYCFSKGRHKTGTKTAFLEAPSAPGFHRSPRVSDNWRGQWKTWGDSRHCAPDAQPHQRLRLSAAVSIQFWENEPLGRFHQPTVPWLPLPSSHPPSDPTTPREVSAAFFKKGTPGHGAGTGSELGRGHLRLWSPGLAPCPPPAGPDFSPLTPQGPHPGAHARPPSAPGGKSSACFSGLMVDGFASFHFVFWRIQYSVQGNVFRRAKGKGLLLSTEEKTPRSRHKVSHLKEQGAGGSLPGQGMGHRHPTGLRRSQGHGEGGHGPKGPRGQT